MSCQHGSNEIDIFGLPEDEEYVDEIDTGGEPLRGQDSQPTQIGKRSTSHMHEAPDEEAETSAKSGKGILSMLSILKVFESQVRVWSILSGAVIRIILSDIASTTCRDFQTWYSVPK